MLFPGMQPCFYPYTMPVFSQPAPQPVAVSSLIPVSEASPKESRESDNHDSLVQTSGSSIDSPSELFKTKAILEGDELPFTK